MIDNDTSSRRLLRPVSTQKDDDMLLTEWPRKSLGRNERMNDLYRQQDCTRQRSVSPVNGEPFYNRAVGRPSSTEHFFDAPSGPRSLRRAHGEVDSGYSDIYRHEQDGAID